MAHQFEVTQADKSFLKVRHPVEGLTFTFHVVRATAAGARLAVPSGKKGAVASKAAHYASHARALAEAEAPGAAMID